MKNLKKALVSSAVGVAVLVSSAAPANAQSYNDYNDRHRGGPSAGEVIAGVAILGGLAAVISAATNNNNNRYDDRYNRYPNTNGYPTNGYPTNGYPSNGYPTNGYDNGYYRGSSQYNDGSQAIQQCIQAAQYEGRRYGTDVRVTQVRDVDRVRNGVRVRGDLVVNEGNRGGNRYDSRYRNNYDSGSFTCTIQRGRVVDVDIRGI